MNKGAQAGGPGNNASVGGGISGNASVDGGNPAKNGAPAGGEAPAKGGAPAGGVLRVLCLGDVVGRAGRRVLKERLRSLRSRLGVDLVIVNGENASGGIGLAPDGLRELLGAGADVVTGGNHIWKHREIIPLLDKEPRLLRPENYGPKAPGRGFNIYVLGGGARVGVLNLLGRVFMNPADNPFEAADAALAALREQSADLVIVDFHAEASSEKRAMVHHLDGRASLVFGTHCHVQSADAHITASGMAAVTDIGMCGVEFDSVIGMNKKAALKGFCSGLPHPFSPATGRAGLNGLLADLEIVSGRALKVQLLRDDPPAFVEL